MEPGRSAKGRRAKAWDLVAAVSAAAGAAAEARVAKAGAEGAVVVLVAGAGRVG